MDVFAVEDESRREWAAQRSQALQCSLPASIATNREVPGIQNMNLNLIALFQIERLRHSGWDSDSK
ncbi:MAG: hypothetical protein WCB76_03305, partial [Acidobacteriaceae bacterium]